MHHNLARHALAFLVLAAFGASASAQGTWVYRDPKTAPPVTGSMAYDAKRGVCVMMCEDVANQKVGVWEWGGVDWSLRKPASSPSRRDSFRVVYDSDRGVTAMYGDGAQSIWEWDGSTWVERKAVTTPGPDVNSQGMAYDAGRKRIVVYGGKTPQNNSRNQTWEWDGKDWVNVKPRVRPPLSSSQEMVYDAARQRVVLFGGRDGLGPSLNHTWEWDGRDWQERFPSSLPPARTGHAMAFDSRRGLVYMFGGNGGPTSSIMFDMFDWNESNWNPITPKRRPARRYGHAMAYDVKRDVLVLFGGNGPGGTLRDTWEYTPGIMPEFKSFGTGCAGTRGAPVLANQLGEMPIAGKPFRLQLSNLPLRGNAWLMFGMSKDRYGNLKLPLDLKPLGMPGCTLYVNGEILFPVQNVLGMGICSLNLRHSWGGNRFYVQGVVADPKANGLGLTTSNATDSLIGN